MKRKSITRYFIILATLLLLGLATAACHQPIMPYATVNKDVLNFRNFSLNAESVNLSTRVKGTIFVKGDIDKSDERHIQISAQLEIDPDDWGGVGFYFPQGWDVTNIASDYPQGNPAPDRYIATLGSVYGRMVYVGSSKMAGSEISGGGEGSVIIDVEPVSTQKDLPESLVITVAAGSKGNTVGPVSQKVSVPLNVDYRIPPRPTGAVDTQADSIVIVTNGDKVRLDNNSSEFSEISRQAVTIIGAVDSSLYITDSEQAEIQKILQTGDYLEIGFNPPAEITTSRIRETRTDQGIARIWETVNLSSAIFFFSGDYHGLVAWPDENGRYEIYGSSVQFEELERMVDSARNQ